MRSTIQVLTVCLSTLLLLMSGPSARAQDFDDLNCGNPADACEAQLCQELLGQFNNLVETSAECTFNALLAVGGCSLCVPGPHFFPCVGICLATIGALDSTCDYGDIEGDVVAAYDRANSCWCQSGDTERCAENYTINGRVLGLDVGQSASTTAQCHNIDGSITTKQTTWTGNVGHRMLECGAGNFFDTEPLRLTGPTGESYNCIDRGEGNQNSGLVMNNVYNYYDCQCPPEQCPRYILTGTASGLPNNDSRLPTHIVANLYFQGETESGLALQTEIDGNGNFQFPSDVPAGTILDLRFSDPRFPECMMVPTNAHIGGSQTEIHVVDLVCQTGCSPEGCGFSGVVRGKFDTLASLWLFGDPAPETIPLWSNQPFYAFGLFRENSGWSASIQSQPIHFDPAVRVHCYVQPPGGVFQQDVSVIVECLHDVQDPDGNFDICFPEPLRLCGDDREFIRDEPGFDRCDIVPTYGDGGVSRFDQWCWDGFGDPVRVGQGPSLQVDSPSHDSSQASQVTVDGWSSDGSVHFFLDGSEIALEGFVRNAATGDFSGQMTLAEGDYKLWIVAVEGGSNAKLFTVQRKDFTIGDSQADSLTLSHGGQSVSWESALQYGEIDSGQVLGRQLRLKNVSLQPVTVNAITRAAIGFEVRDHVPLPVTLQPDAELPFTVATTGGGVASIGGRVNVLTDLAENLWFDVVAIVRPHAELEVAHRGNQLYDGWRVSFGEVDPEQEPEEAIQLSNRGDFDLTISGAAFDEPCSTFTLSPSPTTIAPGASSDLVVKSVGNAVGTSSCILRIAHSATHVPNPMRLVVERTIAQVVRDAEVVGVSMPDSMTCGAVSEGCVTFKNTGNVSWTFDEGYKLGIGSDDPFTTRARQRLNEGEEVVPGAERTFCWDLTAPATAGAYLTDWQMLTVGGWEWFGEVGSRTINVDCVSMGLEGSFVDPATSSRTSVVADSEEFADFDFFYDESQGNFLQAEGGPCWVGHDNPTYVQVRRVGSTQAQDCAFQGSWDPAPIECSQEHLDLFNSGDWVVLNTDDYQFDANTCSRQQPLVPRVRSGEDHWFEVTFVVDDVSHPRRLNFRQANSTPPLDPELRVVANYRPAPGAPRVDFVSGSPGPPPFSYFFDSSKGTFDFRPGGPCRPTKGNDTFLKVRVDGVRIDGCSMLSSWDTEPFQCPAWLVTEINRPDEAMVMNTDDFETAACSPTTEPHCLPGETCWTEFYFEVAGETYTRRIEFIKQ